MNESFHVFLSHNSQDKPIVRKLAQALKSYNLRVWLDEEQLVPGHPWMEALETIIQTTQAAAVLIGESGLGPWEEPEMRACLSEFVKRKLPVIPVLLPGTPTAPKLPLFLQSITWVDLRDGLTDPGLENLVWGITGVKLAKPSGHAGGGLHPVETTTPNSEARSREEINKQVTGYLRWLQERTAGIELRGIERAGGAKVVVLPLETAYVPLRVKTMPRLGEYGADIALNKVLGLHKRLVILGGPGSGKTTVLMHMAWALASSKLAGTEEPAYSRLGLIKELPLRTKKIPLQKKKEPFRKKKVLLRCKSVPLPRKKVPLSASELPLPIFVTLASFARFRRELPNNAPVRDKTLAFFITQHLISKQAELSLADDFFVQLLKDGRNVILLLDGLDEVANEDERAAVREAVEELLRGRKALRVVVACRSIAYRSERTALGADFREIAVQSLDREQHIEPMIRQAYTCIYPLDVSKRDERSNDLLRGIDRLEDERRMRLGKGALAFVDSPLMVRLLLIVHFNERTLPDERADLFNKAINALLQVDYGLDETERRELAADWSKYRDMSQHLAFHMHSQGRDQGREIGEDALKSVLQEEDEFKPHLEDFMRQARQRGSLLEEREEREGVDYRFIHLVFQEFLVARYLREVVGARTGWQAILERLEDRLNDPWWREPILLLVGYMGTNAAKSAREFIIALGKSGRTADMKFYAAELAGTAALEWRDRGSGAALRLDCARRIVDLLDDEEVLKNSQPSLRARVGERLAQLGDPRFDPNHYYLPNDDNLGFVLIPADPDFNIGTRKQDAQRVAIVISAKVPDNEINDGTTPTQEFYIARYPVTVAQFRAFVEATGFKLGNENALHDTENRPVRWVSWYEALAYCNWLNEELKSSPDLASSEIAQLVRRGQWRVRLPSELDWEKAARGGLEGMIFPWGNNPDPNRANYIDSHIDTTSAVGCFPPNGNGLYDMVGNVWEWTRSVYSSYPYQSNDGREEPSNSNPRVLRGGALFSYSRSVRCSVRNYYYSPGDRYYFIGFRVVVSPIFPER